MKKAIFFIVICILNLPVFAIDYNDFPANLQQILNQRTAELTSKGGICIAGRVKMSDGVHISGGEDVMVNLYHGIDAPLWVHENGWFIMDRTLPSQYAGSGKGFVLRAFGYNPIDAPITILQRKMTYVEFVMHKTSPENLASVTGTVVNENDQPFNGVHVSLHFPFANHGRGDIGYTYPHMEITTGADGQYSFKGLSTAEHSIVASTAGYAYQSVKVTPTAGKTVIKNLKLGQNRSIIIDYVYQANGSHSFASGNLQTGTIEWVNGGGGIDFSDGKVEGYEPQSLRDIEMRQDQGVLKFRIFYCNGKNGFYDAGAVAFKSVIRATQTGYSTKEKPCVVGHVYVVRTHEDKYAKFVVRDNP